MPNSLPQREDGDGHEHPEDGSEPALSSGTLTLDNGPVRVISLGDQEDIPNMHMPKKKKTQTKINNK